MLSCSLPALRRIRFTPELPADLAAAVHGLGYGTVTKTAVQYPRRPWAAGFVNTVQVSQRVYEATEGQPGEMGVLMSYTGGAAGFMLAAEEESERVGMVTADHHELHRFSDAGRSGRSRGRGRTSRASAGATRCIAPGR